MRPVLIVGLTAMGVLGGCSSSHPPSAPAPVKAQASQVQSVSCSPSVRAAFAKAASGAVSVQSDVTAGLTTCSYRAAAAKPGECKGATVTINTNPQPFKDFQRWVVESAQNDTTARLGDGYLPHAIGGVGIEADWVPAALDFETATDARWVAVRLTCPSSGQQSLSLAENLARAGLAS